MSNTVFPFAVFGPFRYPPHHEELVVPGNVGVRVGVPQFGPYGLYRCAFNILVPCNGQTNATWLQFLRTMQGQHDSFLWRDPLNAFFYQVTDEAVGSGNGAKTVFPLVMKFVKADTLVVKLDGTPTVAYTLEDNNSAPNLEFSSPPGGGVVVTASYEYYIPVTFDGDPEAGEWFAVASLRARSTAVVEEYSGAHRAA